MGTDEQSGCDEGADPPDANPATGFEGWPSPNWQTNPDNASGQLYGGFAGFHQTSSPHGLFGDFVDQQVAQAEPLRELEKLRTNAAQIVIDATKAAVAGDTNLLNIIIDKHSSIERELGSQSASLLSYSGRLHDVIKQSFDDLIRHWQNDRLYINFLRDRLNNKEHSHERPSAVARIERLLLHAQKFGDDGLETLARLTFPEWGTFSLINAPAIESELPESAPEIYQGLRGPEAPPEFVQRVYGQWIGKGLTRAHIRQLDPKLSTAIENWSRSNKWPEDVPLPTVRDGSRQWRERIEREGFDRAMAGASPSEIARAAARETVARHREKKKTER